MITINFKFTESTKELFSLNKNKIELDWSQAYSSYDPIKEINKYLSGALIPILDDTEIKMNKHDDHWTTASYMKYILGGVDMCECKKERLEERIEEFIKENEIEEVTDNNIIMYLPVSIIDFEKSPEEFNIGTIIKEKTRLFSEEEAMEDIRNYNTGDELKPSDYLKATTTKLFKVLVNKSDIIEVGYYGIKVSKYKIFEEVVLDYNQFEIAIINTDYQYKKADITLTNKITKTSLDILSLDYGANLKTLKNSIKERLDLMDKEWEERQKDMTITL